MKRLIFFLLPLTVLLLATSAAAVTGYWNRDTVNYYCSGDAKLALCQTKPAGYELFVNAGIVVVLHRQRPVFSCKTALRPRHCTDFR